MATNFDSPEAGPVAVQTVDWRFIDESPGRNDSPVPNPGNPPAAQTAGTALLFRWHRLLQDPMLPMQQSARPLRRACSVAAVVLGALADLSPGCATPRRASTAEHGAPTLVITHVTVIDPRDGSALPDRTVAIRGDRIVSVTASAAGVPAGARTVDATHKFMIPGLWDMHVHTFFGTWVPGGREVTLPLFIASGVTGVRDMGSELEPILDARAAIAGHRMVGPRMVISGPMLDGSHTQFPASIAIATPDDG